MLQGPTLLLPVGLTLPSGCRQKTKFCEESRIVNLSFEFEYFLDVFSWREMTIVELGINVARKGPKLPKIPQSLEYSSNGNFIAALGFWKLVGYNLFLVVSHRGRQ